MDWRMRQSLDAYITREQEFEECPLGLNCEDEPDCRYLDYDENVCVYSEGIGAL